MVGISTGFIVCCGQSMLVYHMVLSFMDNNDWYSSGFFSVVDNKYIYHSMRYLFGIYKELIKCGLQRNSDKIVLYRSIYGISSELDITRIYMNTV